MNSALNALATRDSSRLRALQDAVEACDWDALKSAIRTGWFLLTTTDAELALAALERVPSTAIRDEPLIAMQLGILLSRRRFDRARALRYFVSVITSARQLDDAALDPVDRALIGAAETTAYRRLGRYAAGADAARRASALLGALSEQQRSEIGDLSRIHVSVALSLFYAGHVAEALHSASAGIGEVSSMSGEADRLGPLTVLAAIHALQGDMQLAGEYAELIRTGPWSDTERNGVTGGLYCVAEALIALEELDTDAARVWLERLSSALAEDHSSEHWAIVARVQAMVELADGNAARGLAVLDEIARARGADVGERRARAYLAPVRSLLVLALGHPDGARAILRQDLTDGPVARIERARIALALGDVGEALQELRTISAEHLSNRQRAETIAIDLSILLRLPRTPRLSGATQRLGTLLDVSGQRFAVSLLPPTDHTRVVAALERAGFGDATSGGRARSVMTDIEPAALLSTRELAVLAQLWRTGSATGIAKKPTHRCRLRNA